MSGTMERTSRTIPPTGILELSRGNVLLFLIASATVNIRAERSGHSEGINGTTGGIRLERLRPWENLQIIGAAGTTVEFFHGMQDVEKDLLDIFAQVTAIAGTVPVSVQPTSVMADDDFVTVATTDSEVIAGNPLRKKITITAHPNNVGYLYARAAAGVVEGGQLLQAGMSYDFETTADIHIVNADAVNTGDFSWLEHL